MQTRSPPNITFSYDHTLSFSGVLDRSLVISLVICIKEADGLENMSKHGQEKTIRGLEFACVIKINIRVPQKGALVFWSMGNGVHCPPLKKVV